MNRCDWKIFGVAVALGMVMLAGVVLGRGTNEKGVGSQIFINGITLEAPPRKVDSSWAESIKKVNGNWVAIVPYAFSRSSQGRVYYNFGKSGGHHGQWWGEQPEGVAQTIRQARAKGLAVMLKPQVWFSRGWAGDFTLASEQEWKQWESDYTAYMKVMVDLAREFEVEMICLGTELKLSFKFRAGYWEWLIGEVRKVYAGKLTVATNWDNYGQIRFWDKLDYIGIDAYFPLSDEQAPSMATLLKKWEPIKDDLVKLARQKKKPILFTEYGYRSIDQCTWNHWEKEGKNSFPVNAEAQVQAYEALYRVFWSQPWFGGGFLWKWRVPERLGNNGEDKSYSPQNKPAEQVVRRTYGLHRKSLP